MSCVFQVNDVDPTPVERISVPFRNRLMDAMFVGADGYGTGLVIHVARRAGFPATDPRLVRGIRWLETHQRESGRWFTRSLAKDGRHFLTHAGTAFAVLALRACDAEGTHERASAVGH